MTVYEKLKQEQDSLLEKEGSMKMDQNLTVSYEEQKAQWQERKKQQQKENAGIFKKLAPASLIYALIYTVCIYKNMTGAAVLLWVVATIGYICYIVKTVKERKVFKTTIIFAVYMLILAVSTFTTGNEWIIWMNYCWIFAFTVCFLIRNMADENEWNFWDYLCGGVNAVFGAIGSIARPFGDGNDFARLREKKENGKAREILIGIAVAIPVVLLIGGLLMSADLVFSNMIAKVFEGIRIPANLAGICFMLCFGFISSYCGVRYTAYRKDRQDREVKILTETTAMFTVSVLVAVLYVIFCGIQIIYLFGGGGELPAGVTYAEYARQGFFQLLVVCILKSGGGSYNGAFLSEEQGGRCRSDGDLCMYDHYDSIERVENDPVYPGIPAHIFACCGTCGTGSDHASDGRDDLLYLEPQVPVVSVWNGGCVRQLCPVCLCTCRCGDCRL